MKLTHEQRARVLRDLPRAERMARRYLLLGRWRGDPAELSSLAFEALTKTVTTHEPSRGPLATYAFKRLRGLIIEHAGWTGRDPFTRRLAQEHSELGGEPGAALDDALDDALDARRRAVHRAKLEIARLATGALMGTPPPPADERLADREARQRANDALARALDELTAEQVRFVKLRYRDGRSMTEIAELLGCSDRTVRRLNEQTKRDLARLLRAGGVHEPPPTSPSDRFDAFASASDTER